MKPFLDAIAANQPTRLGALLSKALAIEEENVVQVFSAAHVHDKSHNNVGKPDGMLLAAVLGVLDIGCVAGVPTRPGELLIQTASHLDDPQLVDVIFNWDLASALVFGETAILEESPPPEGCTPACAGLVRYFLAHRASRAAERVLERLGSTRLRISKPERMGELFEHWSTVLAERAEAALHGLGLAELACETGDSERRAERRDVLRTIVEQRHPAHVVLNEQFVCTVGNSLLGAPEVALRLADGGEDQHTLLAEGAVRRGMMCAGDAFRRKENGAASAEPKLRAQLAEEVKALLGAALWFSPGVPVEIEWCVVEG